MRSLLELMVLDTLADDVESLEDILRLLNGEGLGWRRLHPAEFTADEVVPALRAVVADGLVAICELGADLALHDAAPGSVSVWGWEDHWYRLTPLGREVHAAWVPPAG